MAENEKPLQVVCKGFVFGLQSGCKVVLGIAGESFEHPLGDVDGDGVSAGFVARPSVA